VKGFFYVRNLCNDVDVKQLFTNTYTSYMNYKKPSFASSENRQAWEKLNYHFLYNLGILRQQNSNSDIVITFEKIEKYGGFTFTYKIEGTDKKLIEQIEGIFNKDFGTPILHEK
jgi:hypothetical protein